MLIRTHISAAVLLTLCIPPGNAEVLSCEGTRVTVRASNFALAEQTCRAAIRTLPLLAECGVVLSQPQNIEIIEAMQGSPGCMGIYHCGENSIEVLSPRAMKSLRRDESAFSSIPTPIYFESVLAHELAHAAYDAVPCPFTNCLVTSEYVAYAMQVYSLPLPEQRLFEADVAMENMVSRYEISSIGLFMAPDKFARNVWAHFSQREDGCTYVSDMMAANFYLDTERPEP
ncbi:DUF6639 family protein [Roseovarius pacificus]|uniref:DUF6639 family protein n=1 Tax=Roseovarius pacificus TaxID=337701 RepID=UPI004039869D